MSQTETLMRYSRQKTEQHIFSMAEAPEMIRQVRAMRQELAQLPQLIADRTAASLEPLDRMARALDQGLDTQRAIMHPLISAAAESIQKQMVALAHDRVQRSAKMALEQHRKAMQAIRSRDGWMKEAKASRKEKAELKEQIQNLRLRFWTATAAASSLAVVLVLVIFARIL